MEERRPVQKLPDELLNNLPELVRNELDEFERQIRKFREGQMGDIKMQKIRLQMGTYAQRQPGVQMQRIKIPYGSLTPDKLRRLADVSDTYANAFMHLTTRQDVQLYFILLEHVPNMMRELADADITTREACGNTIRNVTATPYSGTSPDDVFDVAPYADALVNYMLRNPICQNMGRKVKIAFESNAVKDDAGLRIHDLGFRAHIEKVDGKPRRGFEVYVGGGLGSNPMLGHRWPEIIPEEEFIPFSAAIIRIFDRYGERKSRMKARMKFLVKKLGFEEFRKRVEEERRVLKPEPEWTSWIEAAHRLDTPPEGPLPEVNIHAGMESDPEYLAWKRDAVVMQNTGKHALVHLRIHNGDLSSDDARTLADISEKYTGGDIRITIHQNLVFRWVDPAVLPALYTAIRDAGLVTRGAETISDITACPGADTCRLGITSAKGLATALNKALENGMSTYRETARKLKIKISGCPNGCAQHTTSNIGFQGAALAKDGRRVPAEMVFVGGALLGEETRLADSILKIPTRNAPKVVKKLIDIYISERKDDEEHFDFVMKRLGKDHLKGELEEFTAIPAYEDAPEFYQDWGHEDQKFDIMTGIKGECAGATVEDKVPDFEAAEKALQQAEAHFMHEDYEVAMLEAYHAMADAAHVPLYSKLVDPFTPAQTTWEFENLFVRTGEVDAKWMDIHEKLEEMVVSEATKERASEMIDWAKEFYEVCREAELQLKNKATA